MTLQEVRGQIDAIDPQIKELIMRRMDCSHTVAEVKAEAGETMIYRADREKAILERLGEGIPEDRKAAYLSVVKKIMETSRMYQYGLLYDRMPDIMNEYFEGLTVCNGGTRVRVQLTCEDKPGALASILSMIADYGYDLNRLETVHYNKTDKTVTFELEILGDLSEKHMKILMFQLSRESKNFKIISNE